jgi:hypothetical protein
LDVRRFDIEFFKQCVFCGANLAEHASKEHVFPRLIGGRYVRYFVCKACNSQFGRTFDSDLRKNPFVHAANQCLGFAGSGYLKGQKISGLSPTGHRVKMAVTKETQGPVIIPSRQEDGSIDSHPEIFLREISHKLRESGATDSQVEEFRDLHASAPLGIYVPIPGRPGEHFCNKAEDIAVEYTDMREPFRSALVARIAVEMYYVSGIFLNLPADLAEVKAAVRDADPNRLSILCPEYGRIANVQQVPYQPFHSVCFATHRGALAALICFFGFFKFAVCLARLSDPGIGNANSYYMTLYIGTAAEIPRLEKKYPSSEKARWDSIMMYGAIGKWLACHRQDEAFPAQ